MFIEHHKDWLVHNLAGEPIHIGKAGGKNTDELYALGSNQSRSARVHQIYL